MNKKPFLYNTDAIYKTIAVLIPKRRGEGYLKSPFGGHHSNKYYWGFLGQFSSQRSGLSNVSDIDGYLSIGVHLADFEDEFNELEEKVIKALGETFDHVEGYEKITQSQFWEIIENS